MEFIIATYRSRNKAIDVFHSLSDSGFVCSLITTPQAARVGCGLSVRFSPNDFSRLNNLLSNVASFSGFFRVVNLNGKTIVVPT